MRQVVKDFFSAREGQIELWGTSLNISRGHWVIDKRHNVWHEPQAAIHAFKTVITSTPEARFGVVLVPQRVFNILVVEGVITLEQLEFAEEDRLKPAVTVRDVEVEGKRYTIRTIPSDDMIMKFGCELVIVVDEEDELMI